MKRKVLNLLIVGLITSIFLTGCGTAKNDSKSEAVASNAGAESKERTYYYVAPYMGHPYVYDQFLGFKYAAEKYGVKIVQAGPDGFDTQAATEAFEQAIAKKPDGIVTVMWDGSLVAPTKTAMEQGIPVITIEAAVQNHGSLTYIGLDNYQNGWDTAQALIDLAGDSGKVVLQSNFGASNTDEKCAGVRDRLAGTGWEIVAEINDESNAQKAIEVAKAAMNNYPEATAFLGMNSASGPGIAAAMEELNKAPDSLYVVANDREDMTLEYIEEGYIDYTLCNKTAMQAYMAISLLENYNRFGMKDVPISADNKGSDVNVFPDEILTGTFRIGKDNVDTFRHENMDTYDTDLYIK